MAARGTRRSLEKISEDGGRPSCPEGIVELLSLFALPLRWQTPWAWVSGMTVSPVLTWCHTQPGLLLSLGASAADNTQNMSDMVVGPGVWIPVLFSSNCRYTGLTQLQKSDAVSWH
ncbi:hypothetical protein RRG08_044650 [Elysia crispata]|uniref:Uncharacterized protein n=1 Tax=Elysia crispata TaxID=231223 RepID=A0AAE1EA00_9GAST|nr:hypothetical protein RRG08_044650 [Elysia crispata]